MYKKELPIRIFGVLSWPRTRRHAEWLLPTLTLLAALNSGLYQLHPRIGWVDPGLYINHFLNLPLNIYNYGQDYHSTRLPFVLTGRLFYTFFSPIYAQVLLVNFFYILSGLALLSLSRALVQDARLRIAFVLGIALNPTWIACFVEGYVNGPAMTFALFSVAATMAKRPVLMRLRRETWAGISAALSVSTHPIPGIFAGFVLLLAPLLSDRDWRQCIIAWTWAMLGGVAALAALGSVGLLQGAPFLFLLGSVGPATRSLEGLGLQFMAPVWNWLPNATRTIVLPLTVVVLIALALFRKRSLVDTRYRGLLASCIVGCGTFLALQIPWPGYFVQFHFYGSYIFLFLVPPLAILLNASHTNSNESSATLLILVTILLGLLLPLTLGSGALLPGSALSFIWASLFVLTALTLIGLMLGLRRASYATVLLTLGVAAIADHETAVISRLHSTAEHSAQFQFIHEIQNLLQSDKPKDTRVFTWFNRDNFNLATANSLPRHDLVFQNEMQQLNLLDSVVATLGWNVTSLGFKMPMVEDTVFISTRKQLAGLLSEPSRLLLLCTDDAECRNGLATLEDLEAPKVHVVERRRTQIRVPGIPALTAVLADISSRRDTIVYGGSPFQPLTATTTDARPPEADLTSLTEERHWLVREGVRLHSEEFECDRRYVARIVRELPRVRIPSGFSNNATELNSITIEVAFSDKSGSPQELQMARMARLPVCRARVSLKPARIREFAFLQEGLDRVLSERGYRPLLTSQGAEAALTHPCKLDAIFINALVDADPSSNSNLALAKEARTLLQHPNGRPLRCVYAIVEFTERWPNAVSSGNLPADSESCSAGISLLAALAKAPLKGSLPETIAEHHQQALSALQKGDFSSCIRGAVAGRQAYWNFIRKT